MHATLVRGSEGPCQQSPSDPSRSPARTAPVVLLQRAHELGPVAFSTMSASRAWRAPNGRGCRFLKSRSYCPSCVHYYRRRPNTPSGLTRFLHGRHKTARGCAGVDGTCRSDNINHRPNIHRDNAISRRGAELPKERIDGLRDYGCIPRRAIHTRGRHTRSDPARRCNHP